jgi:hypothetical protein
MGSKCIGVVVFSLAVPLCGCGAVDSQVTYVPAFFRQPAPKAAEIEQPPDVHLIVRNNISALFMVASAPSNISVSFPIPAANGEWTTCVKATTTGATGKSLGMQTYLLTIEHDQIDQRERVDGTHWCAKETYQPL